MFFASISFLWTRYLIQASPNHVTFTLTSFCLQSASHSHAAKIPPSRTITNQAMRHKASKELPSVLDAASANLAVPVK